MDRCSQCAFRNNIEMCHSIKCDVQNYWIVKEQKAEIERLKDEIVKLTNIIVKGHDTAYNEGARQAAFRFAGIILETSCDHAVHCDCDSAIREKIVKEFNL